MIGVNTDMTILDAVQGRQAGLDSNGTGKKTESSKREYHQLYKNGGFIKLLQPRGQRLEYREHYSSSQTKLSYRGNSLSCTDTTDTYPRSLISQDGGTS